MKLSNFKDNHKLEFLPKEVSLTDFMNYVKSQDLNVVGNEQYWINEYNKYLDFRHANMPVSI